MRIRPTARAIVSAMIMAVCLSVPALPQEPGVPDLTSFRATPARIVEPIDDTRLVTLTGNVHPLARPEFDRGPVEGTRMLDRMILVLNRSPQQQDELTQLNQDQYDPGSPLFHHWLHAADIGRLFGPSDADLAQVTGWLGSHGFEVNEVSQGRLTIDFSGTVAQVQQAFHTEIHNYLVEGQEHIANNSDPQIPEALAPVVAGVFSLNDFRHPHQSFFGDYIRRDLHTGKMTRVETTQEGQSKPVPALSGQVHANGSGKTVTPDLGYTNEYGETVEDLTPYDVATVYNILPLWDKGINGKGVTVAIIGVSDIEASDIATFRRSFDLPASAPNIIFNGKNPGYVSGGQQENTEDVEMAGSTAPGAQIDLVVSANTSTTGGDVLSTLYIVDKEVAPIASGSYGTCELALGTAGNSMYNQLWQQAATAGISVFESAGDQGSAGCNNQNAATPNADTTGLQVNGIASSPYLTAVGGTDFTWSFIEHRTPISTYWNSTNNPTTGASAKGYIPEMSWNSTCTNPLLLNIFVDGNGNPFPSTEALCNAAIDGAPDLVKISGGSGGVSHCTAPTGSTPASCAGGYAKPSWQTGSGVPNDGKRDVPDVSMFASYGFSKDTTIASTTLLICQASNSPETSCNYNNPDYIIYQENGGTSAAAPLTAGIMALVVQKTGTKQGLANPVFYELASRQKESECNSTTVKNGNSCIFYDTTQGTNTQVCISGHPNCVTRTSGDEVGELSGYSAVSGYDSSTGLGTPNVTNLVNAWPTSSGATYTLSVSPASLSFASTKVGSTTAAQTVTVKNTGTGTVTMDSISFTGTDASSFLKSATTCGSSLAKGDSCTISVEFKPAAAGTLTASLAVADNATGTPQKVALTGTATAAATYTLSVSPSSLSFASTKVGSTTAAQTVTLKNTGTGTVTVDSISFTGTDASSFLKSATTCGSSLAKGDSCTISVKFKPAAAGTLTGSLAVADNATGTPQKVALKGTATAAAVQAPAASLSPVPASLP